MKCCKRYLSVLLCFVLLSLVFSVGVSAESSTITDYKITSQATVTCDDGTYSLDSLVFYPNNGTVEKSEYKSIDGYFTQFNMQNSGVYSTAYNISLNDNSELLKANQNHTVKLNNFYFSSYIESIINGNFYSRVIHDLKIYIIDTSGKMTLIDDYELTTKAPNFSVSFDVTPENNIKSIYIVAKSYIYTALSFTTSVNGWIPVTSYLGEFNGDNSYTFDVNIESEEAGLLKGVIEWLKGIKNNLTEGFSNIFDSLENGFSNLWSSIVDLPMQIWTFIENGLKSLFVPDDEFITDFKNDIDEMLASKFGAVYQCVNLLFEGWDNIHSNTQDNIEIPSTTINLGNETFTFGGWEVDVVPNNFEWIADILKTLSGLLCTLMFVNGLRKRYDEVMGVEQ